MCRSAAGGRQMKAMTEFPLLEQQSSWGCFWISALAELRLSRPTLMETHSTWLIMNTYCIRCCFSRPSIYTENLEQPHSQQGVQGHVGFEIYDRLFEIRKLRWSVSARLCLISCKESWAPFFQLNVISPDFSLELTWFFPGKHLIHFLVLKMKNFRNFVLHNCILVFDAEQVYLELQVINLKNKEVTVNPKPHTKNPIP